MSQSDELTQEHDVRAAGLAEVRDALVSFANGRFCPAPRLPSTGTLGEVAEALTQLGSRIERTLAEHEKIAELTRKINDGFTLDEVLEHVFESFRELLPYNRIGFAEIMDDGTVVRARWARSDQDRMEITKGYSVRMAETSLREIMQSGVPRILNDLQAYLEEHPESDSTRRIVGEGMQSSLTCPLVARGRPLGFIFFSSVDRHAYATAHIETYLKIARQLAIVLEKARLYQAMVDTQQSLEEANRKLAILASMDGLTGIANRRRFDDVYDAEWRRATRGGLPISVLLIDIDHFKQYNDTLGHQAGDDMLRAIAATLRDTLLRANDFVARYGGEEFAVILSNTSYSDAEHTAEKLRHLVANLDLDHAGPISISVGVATRVPELDDRPAMLITAADEALYRAKREGRNRVCGIDLSP